MSEEGLLKGDEGSTVEPSSTESTAPKAAEVVGLLRILSDHQTYSLPLPPPRVLEQYNRLVPDAAERFFRSWEQESDHRRQIEQRKLDERQRTQWIAFALALTVLGAAVYSLYRGEMLTGTVVLLGELIALASLFLLDQKSKLIKKKEQTEQSDQST